MRDHASPMRATQEERDRLHDTFAALCRIPSPSGDERACADWIRHELGGLGLEVEQDDAGHASGSNAGNLLAQIRSETSHSVMFCAHMDTVPPQAPLEPVVDNGGWVNANAGILGADNKAAIAVLLELARGIVSKERLCADQPARPAIELLFTVSEENGLRGAKAFDVGRLQSQFGFVFDHASPIGEIVVASPTYSMIAATFTGRAAHAGIRPEAGRSAIQAAARAISSLELGRLDDETTANVGLLQGGSAPNVVPERCRLDGEVRSLSETRLQEVVTQLLDRPQDAADAGQCDLDMTVERMFKGYRVNPRNPQLALAETALRAAGYEPRRIATGGGSDANAFQEQGFPCLNMANGTERNHEPGERVSAVALEGMLDVALALVAESGRVAVGPQEESQ